MNPFQKNKVDMSALSPEEQKAFRMYGKLPNRKDVLQNKLKERKYFDSGDYALSKAGATSDISPTDVGREHPVPENIPHLSSSPSNSSTPTLEHQHSHGRGSISGPSGAAASSAAGSGAGGGVGIGTQGFQPPTSGAGQNASPVKEGGSWLQREESIDDQPGEDGEQAAAARGPGVAIRGSRP